MAITALGGYYNPTVIQQDEFDEVTGNERTEQSFLFNRISTAVTTVVKTGVGVLQRIIVTGGTTGTIIIYDNTAASGTKIADFDTTNAIATYEFNTGFTTGLTVITSAATKVTVVYA